MWKEREKLQKFEYLKNEKSFLDQIKSIFHSFEGLSFGEKIINSGNKLKNIVMSMMYAFCECVNKSSKLQIPT